MGFQAETLALIDRAVLDAGISQREIARRLCVSEARVCQMLSSNSNLTLRSVERLLATLQPEPHP